MMLSWLPFVLAAGLVFYLISWARARYLYGPLRREPEAGVKQRREESFSDSWSQLYETASREEAQRLKAYLEEREIQSVLFEQGKIGLDGRPMAGLGFAVPKNQLRLAQGLLVRFLDKNK